MTSATEKIERSLGGTWLIERSENVTEYLTELGVGNYVRRSMTEVESTQTISVFGDVIRLEMKCGDKQHVKLEFRLNEEFQIDAGQPSLARACWEHGALVLTVRRLGCRRLQVIERRLVGDRLVQTMRCNNVTCTRVMRRMQTT